MSEQEAARNADLDPRPAEAHTIKVVEPTQFQIVGPDGRPLLTIHRDGRWEFPDDAAPTEAAQVFVREVQRIVAGQAATKPAVKHEVAHEHGVELVCSCGTLLSNYGLTRTLHSLWAGHLRQALAEEADRG